MQPVTVEYYCPACQAVTAPDAARSAAYRCPNCRQAYLVQRSTAPNRLGTVIPGPATRVPGRDHLSTAGRSTTPAATAEAAHSELVQPESDMVAVAILPPPLNQVDVTAMEQLAGTFDRLPSPVALEIAGQATERRLIVRGERRSVERVVHQLYQVYRQVDAQALSTADDPVHALVQPNGVTGVIALRPAKAAFVSLRTWREFEGNDPLNPVLGTLAGLGPDEVVLSQVIIHGAAPERWASPFLHQLNLLKRGGSGGWAAAAMPDLFVGTVGAILALFGVGAFLIGRWSSVAWPGTVSTVLGVVCFAVGLWLMLPRRTEWAETLDAEAEAKLKEQAFQVEVRLYAHAASADRTQALLDRLTATYRLFNTTSGNQLKSFPVWQFVAPDEFAAPDPKGVSLLSVREIAGLWHVPVGEAPQLAQWAMYQRLVPLPKDVTFPGGVTLGVSRRWAQSVPVQLSPQALNRNILIVGKSQFGKTTLMEHVAAHWMADRERAVLVVDPHGDLARRVVGLVPPERLGDVIAIDLSDPTRSVGLNLLDVAGGASPDDVSESFVDVGKALWGENWGPRMQVPLVSGLKALAYANLRRDPGRQYTILSLVPLLNCEGDDREAFLNSEVPARERPDLFRYFFGEFASLSDSMREQVISPVLSKAHAFERAAAIRRVVGQPRSTLNLYDAIRQHKIIILNTNVGVLGDDLSDFVGSFFLNVLRRVIMSQSQLPRAERVRVSAVVDEFQKLTGVDHAALLGELQKYGGNFVLGTQTLGNLRQPGAEGDIVSGVLAGVATLVAFQLNGEDAAYLTERDFDRDQLRPQSLIHLPTYAAYVRTLTPDGRVPAIFSLEMVPPLSPDEDVSQRVLARASAYTVPADEADRMANFSFGVFEEEWELGSRKKASKGESAETASDSDAPPTHTADGEVPAAQEAAGAPLPRRQARPPGWYDRQMPQEESWADVAGKLNSNRDES